MPGKVICIEIGSNTTRVCEMDYKSKVPHIYRWVSFATPKNTYEDGFIRDKKLFAEAVKEEIRKAGFKTNKVVFSVNSSKIATREVLIPLVKENRILEVVNANASEYFPVDVSEYILSYSILEKMEQEEDKKYRLMVLAAPENLIKNYYNIAELLGYEVASIDYGAIGSYHFLRNNVGKGNVLLVQFNEMNTLVHIIEKGHLQLQRNIEFGYMALLQLLLDSKGLQLNSKKEALKLLKQDRFIYDEEEAYDLEEAAFTIEEDEEEVKNAAQRLSAGREITELYRQYFVGNVVRILDYYSSRNKDKRIDEIVMTGEGAEIKGAINYLNRVTDIKIGSLASFSGIQTKKSQFNTEEYLYDFISCIGAGINPVGFLPRDYYLREKKNSNVKIFKVVFGGAFVIGVFLITSSYLTYQTAKLENTSLTGEIQRLSEVNALYEENMRIHNAYKTLSSMYGLTANPNIWLGDLITQLEKQLPVKTVVESFSVTSEGITLNIACDSKKTAAKTLMQLKEISYLTEVQTGGITQSEDENGMASVKFTITAGYNLTLLEEASDEINN